MKKQINNELVDLTVEELAQRETDIADAKERQAKREEEILNKENLKASAKAKLMSGEALTEEEANTIVL
tara:strand:+ start:477 stop:683 length:207 start_codon:yes stop_codon:yes gene_type:complete